MLNSNENSVHQKWFKALDSGVNFFALWHTEELGGITLYPTKEYNNISYNYFKDPTLWQLK